jgi:alkylation response protein AidB-like acyl-CoA dehydrogenase
MIYTAPVRDMMFNLFDVIGMDHPNAPQETVEAVLTEAARFCETVALPLNASGDAEGARFDAGKVTTPKGFKDAYKAYVDGGWPSLGCAEADGGQGLPEPLQFALVEMLTSANMAFGLCPLLTTGAYHALSAHGSADLKSRYLPKLVDGTWPGTMCLTEAHCGTDLGLMKTKAAPQADGSHKLTGTKIFITYGEHDLTENIVHLVLAKLPDAPPGVKGISLFLSPKILPDGTRNAISCGSIEHKHGINGSPTCVMNFDGATGWLVGEPHKGLACMFTMMNNARLQVGIQGLGIAETAYQTATAYAKSRLQMRAVDGVKKPELAADPIIVHPDVRRMLMNMRATTEAARVLALWVGNHLEMSKHHEDPAQRQRSDDLVQLLTPVVKACLTDHGTASANDAIQVHGGHGFIKTTGVEQLARDGRIAQIYEGTNGIQALDLIGRKRNLHNGRLLQTYFAEIDMLLSRADGNSALQEFTKPLAQALATLKHVTETLGSAPLEAPSAAVDYTRLFSLVSLCHMWGLITEAALPKTNDSFYATKLKLARYFMLKVLPEIATLQQRIAAGTAPVMALAEDEF